VQGARERIVIQPERIGPGSGLEPVAGEYVLYWMQSSQRGWSNHALEYAIERANSINRPVYVCFGLDVSYPEANHRSFAFMLQGLRETAEDLKDRGIPFFVREGPPYEVAAAFGEAACLIVTDRGYLRHLVEWRERVAAAVDCPLVVVESGVVVPVEAVSGKDEWSAATIRPKILRHMDRYLVPLVERRVRVPLLQGEIAGAGVPAIDRLRIDPSVPEGAFKGGPSEARRRLGLFCAERLSAYEDGRNDPNRDVLSNMSPYLHFGQISPVEIALAVRETGLSAAGAYLEEAIVRRELAVNFVRYNPRYDAFDGLPPWAKKTLADHARDRREYLYTRRELEEGRTHDPYWNAAQRQMAIAGKMHGYMRMYWGKKILEWSETPEAAYETALYLNNRYEIDGRDPNGYAGVAWCFGKHDRPWKEREIFGKIRYMNARGLKRKFDAEIYAQTFPPGGRKK
jgi:deoxyribodipyrimidine photo-lyase